MGVRDAPPPPAREDPRPFEIEVRAPRGFRPSDWPERLMNFDECENLGADFLYTKFTSDGQILIMRAEIADPVATNAKARTIVLRQILGFAFTNGLVFSFDVRLEANAPELFRALHAALDHAQIPAGQRSTR